MKGCWPVLMVLLGCGGLAAEADQETKGLAKPLGHVARVVEKWGFAILSLEESDRRPFEGGDVLVVRTNTGEFIELVVAEKEKNDSAVAELAKSSKRKEIGQLAIGDPIIALRKGGSTPAAASKDRGNFVVREIPEDAKLVGWNRQWGFKIYRLADGTEVIRQEKVETP